MSKNASELFSQGLAPFSGLAGMMAKMVVKLGKGGDQRGEEGPDPQHEVYDDDRETDTDRTEVFEDDAEDPTPLGLKLLVKSEEGDQEKEKDDLESLLGPDTEIPGAPVNSTLSGMTAEGRDWVEKEEPIKEEQGEQGATATVARTLPYPDVDTKAAKLGMSACLMGEEVRYNGGHCRARRIMEGMQEAFTFVPVCPEIDIGLGVPRPTLRLVAGVKLSKDTDLEDIHKSVQLWCPEKSQDLTEAMDTYTALKVAELRSFGIDGFILKRDSPSCGLDRVKLYEGKKEMARGMKMYRGLFARGLLREWPELPVSDEGRLGDEDTRNNFLASVVCHQRWRSHDGSFKGVLSFHASHKYTLMVQSPKVLKELGGVLAKGPKFFKENNISKMYYTKFFGAMKIMVGRGRHTNVLLHLAGHLKHSLDAELYKDLLGCVSDYQDGLVPLVVPLHLLQVYSKPGKVSDEDNGKYLLSISSYVQAAPRSLKAHTSISNRTDSKLPRSAEGESALKMKD